MRVAVILGALALVGSTAHAGDVVDEPAASPFAMPELVPVPIPEPEPPRPTDPRDDAAWDLYHRAFTALADHDRDGARGLLAKLAREHPGHPATVAATRVAEVLKVPPDGVIAHVSPELTDEPTSNARAELATVQTLHGAVVGIELCAIGGCSGSNAAPFGLALIGASLGALATLSGFDSVRPSTRSLIDGGTVFGFMEGLFGSLTATSNVSPTILLIGQVGGLGLGAVIDQTHPTAGQVALASSGGTWTTIVGLLAFTALSPNPSDSATGLVGLVSLNVGLAGGALLAATHPKILRGQTLVIDAAALVGGIGGGAIATVITNDATAPLVLGAASAGAALGLVVSLLLTPEISHPSKGPAVQTFVTPAEHGRGALVGAGFRF